MIDIEQMRAEHKNTPVGRVTLATIKAMDAQIKKEQLINPNQVIAELEAARVIAITAILDAFQSNEDIMFSTMDDFAETLKDGLREVHGIAFATRH